MTLESLATALRSHPAIRSKLAIGAATRAPGLGGIRWANPAMMPQSCRAGGYDVLAGEGFIAALVQNDRWFADWCGVMVNLSDIAAMVGCAAALTDQIWAADAANAAPLLAGLRAASAACGLPLIGGHTNFAAKELSLALSVMARAEAMIGSFAAIPGEVLIVAIDQRSSCRNFENFCAALDAPTARLRSDLALMPALAEVGLMPTGMAGSTIRFQPDLARNID